jgi:phosphoribosylformylglycinamidine cyclo-ligase
LQRPGGGCILSRLGGPAVSQDRYKDAGVDIDAGAALVDRIGALVARTMRPEVVGGLGHFGALWSIPAGKYRELMLVSGADGVGTKVKVAQAADRHDTVGIDLVAMCANDILCAGAEPFYFLDYFATGKLDVGVGEQVVAGIAEGCHRAGCALVGGETAEMPGVYGPGVYDLAGFCVGGVERDEVLDGSKVRAGMTLLGLASSGLHSNGYSLVRKVVFEEAGLALGDELPGTGRTVADALLEPTAMYCKPVLALLKQVPVASICHVTGGGLPENLPRVLAGDCAAVVDRSAWALPPVFAAVRDLGGLSDRDLLRTFNCGVGMALTVPRAAADDAVALLGEQGVAAFPIGEIAPRDGEAVVFS